MDVGQAHEDAYHQSLIMEISVLVNFFNNHNLAIGGSYDNTFRILHIEKAAGTLVEIKNNAVNHYSYCHKCPKRPWRADIIP